MRILFVTHDVGLYGASRSLQPVVKGFAGDEVDLMVSRRLSGNVPLAELHRRFGTHVRRIHRCFLPFDRVYQGKDPNRVRSAASTVARVVLWQLQRSRVRRLFAAQRYDAIHLNSLTLFRLLDPSFPFFIHVREIYDGSDPAIWEALRAAHGVIFIDEATKRPFSHLKLTRTVVLNNPIDMTSAEIYRAGSTCEEYQHTTVFAMIGKLSDNKGSLFVIEAFRRLTNEKAALLIVGDGERNYVNACRRAAAGDRRIQFLGEEPAIEKIYALTDYVLRGEGYPCVGRTVYEGLYAGCEVIVPGGFEAEAQFFETNRFSGKLHFYEPRNKESLLRQLEQHAGRKVSRRHGFSNVSEYLTQFKAFVSSNTVAHPIAGTHGPALRP